MCDILPKEREVSWSSGEKTEALERGVTHDWNKQFDLELDLDAVFSAILHWSQNWRNSHGTDIFLTIFIESFFLTGVYAAFGRWTLAVSLSFDRSGCEIHEGLNALTQKCDPQYLQTDSQSILPFICFDTGNHKLTDISYHTGILSTQWLSSEHFVAFLIF